MEELLKPYVERALKAMEKGGEFIIEQAPVLLQEFYTWHFYKNITILILSLLVTTLSITMGLKFKERTNSSVWIASVSTSVFSTLFTVMALFNIIQLTVAPKLYLIEHFFNHAN